MADQKELIVLLRCHNLPGTRFEGRLGVRLGIQRGKEVVEDVPADVQDVTFTVPLRVGSNAKDGRPNFLGAYAQGTPEERFVYLCWGERVGETWDVFRRVKIPLKQLDWEPLQQSWSSGAPIEITIDMTDKNGGPVCGSVKV